VSLLLLLLLLGAPGLLAARRRPASPAGLLDRRVRQCRLAGLALGVVGALAVSAWGALGRGPLLFGPVLALGVLAGVLAGEVSALRPSGPSRRALVEVRRVRDYLPPRATAVVAGAGVLLAGVTTATTVAGAPDDLGRAGRALVYRCDGVLSGATGPWPGAYYAAPLAAVVVGGLLAAGVVLAQVVRRPRPDLPREDDDRVRRGAAEAVVAACGVLVGLPLAGTALVAAAALTGVDCPTGVQRAAADGLLLLVPLAVALLIWCTGVLLAAGPPPARTRRAARAAAGAR
jgi:hypothetical protein